MGFGRCPRRAAERAVPLRVALALSALMAAVPCLAQTDVDPPPRAPASALAILDCAPSSPAPPARCVLRMPPGREREELQASSPCPIYAADRRKNPAQFAPPAFNMANSHRKPLTAKIPPCCRQAFPFPNKLLPFLTESPRGCFWAVERHGEPGLLRHQPRPDAASPAHIGPAEAARGGYLERNRRVRIACMVDFWIISVVVPCAGAERRCATAGRRRWRRPQHESSPPRSAR